MPVLEAKAGGGAKLEQGSYVVTCMNAKEDTLENSQFGDGHILRISLECDDEFDEDGPVQLDAIANYKLSPKSKLWKFIEAFGFKLEVGASFDTDSLIGKKALATVEDHESDGVVFSRVRDLSPLPKGMNVTRDTPALIKSDGTADWAVFWNTLTTKGITKSKAAGILGYDDMAAFSRYLATLDGPDAAELYMTLTEPELTPEEKVPFER